MRLQFLASPDPHSGDFSASESWSAEAAFRSTPLTLIGEGSHPGALDAAIGEARSVLAEGCHSKNPKISKNDALTIFDQPTTTKRLIMLASPKIVTSPEVVIFEAVKTVSPLCIITEASMQNLELTILRKIAARGSGAGFSPETIEDVDADTVERVVTELARKDFITATLVSGAFGLAERDRVQPGEITDKGRQFLASQGE